MQSYYTIENNNSIAKPLWQQHQRTTWGLGWQAYGDFPIVFSLDTSGWRLSSALELIGKAANLNCFFSSSPKYCSFTQAWSDTIICMSGHTWASAQLAECLRSLPPHTPHLTTHSLDPEEWERDEGTDSHQPYKCLPNCYSQEENENTQAWLYRYNL